MSSSIDPSQQNQSSQPLPSGSSNPLNNSHGQPIKPTDVKRLNDLITAATQNPEVNENRFIQIAQLGMAIENEPLRERALNTLLGNYFEDSKILPVKNFLEMNFMINQLEDPNQNERMFLDPKKIVKGSDDFPYDALIKFIDTFNQAVINHDTDLMNTAFREFLSSKPRDFDKQTPGFNIYSRMQLFFDNFKDRFSDFSIAAKTTVYDSVLTRMDQKLKDEPNVNNTEIIDQLLNEQPKYSKNIQTFITTLTSILQKIKNNDALDVSSFDCLVKLEKSIEHALDQVDRQFAKTLLDFVAKVTSTDSDLKIIQQQYELMINDLEGSPTLEQRLTKINTTLNNLCSILETKKSEDTGFITFLQNIKDKQPITPLDMTTLHHAFNQYETTCSDDIKKIRQELKQSGSHEISHLHKYKNHPIYYADLFLNELENAKWNLGSINY